LPLFIILYIRISVMEIAELGWIAGEQGSTAMALNRSKNSFVNLIIFTKFRENVKGSAVFSG